MRLSLRIKSLFVATIALLLVAAPCAVAQATPPATSPSDGKAVVVWINVDGLRGDYVERADAPFLQRLAAEGAYTTKLAPIFPSLTFPTHLAMATGRGVEGHGVPGNSFYDRTTGETLHFPPQSSLVRIEAIWNTAARQGVRAAVVDWPMSHQQEGQAHPAAYYGQRFDGSLTDRQRLENLLTIWRDDNAGRGEAPPLRLLMGYASHVDTVGHHAGPTSDETMRAVREVDALLQDAFEAAVVEFEKTMGPADELYFIVTTDHGMSSVHARVNLPLLLGEAWDEAATFVRGGSTATLFFDHLQGEVRTRAIERTLEALAAHDFITAWRAENVPERYDYSDPTRVGPIVLSLDAGFTFDNGAKAGVAEVPADRAGGMHGYPADANPDMLGFAVIYRHRQLIGGKNLGEVDQRRLYPTVAKLLGIEPAAGVTVEPIDLE